MVGRNNTAFGFFYLLFALGTGLYAAPGAGGQAAALQAASIHAFADSVLNIIVGYLICRLPFVGWLSRAISILMISGALLHSGALYLTGLNLLPFALAFIPLGGFLIIAVLLFMGVGVIGMRAAR